MSVPEALFLCRCCVKQQSCTLGRPPKDVQRAGWLKKAKNTSFSIFPCCIVHCRRFCGEGSLNASAVHRARGHGHPHGCHVTHVSQQVGPLYGRGTCWTLWVSELLAYRTNDASIFAHANTATLTAQKPRAFSKKQLSRPMRERGFFSVQLLFWVC